MMRSLPTIKFPGDLDWGTWIHRWDRMQDRYILRRRERFELMLGLIAETQKSVSRVLDLGCGTGSLLLRVLEEFPKAEVYGVDFDLTLLALAERRLDKFGGRIGLIEADFRDPSWVKLVPNCMNAVVSTTALHWLSPEQLARLYGQLGQIIGPGGIFLNADHVRSNCEHIQRLWERNREQMRRLEGDISADDWEGFWDAYGRALKMDIKKFRKELTEPWEGSEEGLPLGWHFERLKASGFEAADCFWRLDCDAVYGGIRR
ncbi:MAG: class I SAM-dependent methyltransferase [Planctomycetota bacterium]|jgi:SAM-dependent methyltransferase